MKKCIVFILSLLLFSVVYAKPYLVYTSWSTVFPEGVEEFRIESEDRYLWSRINEDGEYEQTDEYYAYLEGYERIDDSIKTFYRVINSEKIMFNSMGSLVTDTNECSKVFCIVYRIKKYEEPHEEEQTRTEVETINPETYDGIYNYLVCFTICTIIIIIMIKNRSSYVESL